MEIQHGVGIEDFVFQVGSEEKSTGCGRIMVSAIFTNHRRDSGRFRVSFTEHTTLASRFRWILSATVLTHSKRQCMSATDLSKMGTAKVMLSVSDCGHNVIEKCPVGEVEYSFYQYAATELNQAGIVTPNALFR